MPSSITQVRNGLAAVFANIPGLAAYVTVPTTPVAPCVIIKPVSGQFDETIASGGDTFNYDVLLLSSQAATPWDNAQNLLDQYLARSGTMSIRGGLQSDVTLGGTCHTSRVSGWSDYGTISYGGLEWFGVKFKVEVWPL